MLRTVELGRAVITTTEASLELWLTTSITLSPKENCFDLEHLSNSALINVLNSGEAWMYRSECMKLVLDISMRGEPVDRYGLETLAAGIVNAPAWGQLNLLPFILEHKEQFDVRAIHVGISQSSHDIDDGIKKCHRLVATLVPDGVPTLSLHSVHLNLIVSENMSKTTLQRQRKSQMESSATGLSQDVCTSDTGKRDTSSAFSDEEFNLEHCSDEEILFTTTSPPLLLQSGKRKRSTTLSDVQMQAPHLTDFPGEIKRYGPGTSSASNNSALNSHALQQSELRLLSYMVDAAVRFSVLNSLKGSAIGLKVKANNFTARLADVAPALWRPGFLSALSQRACLTPTLSLSLDRIMSRAQTMSFEAKIPVLRDRMSENEPLLTTPTTNLDTNSMSAICTWVYAHRCLLSRPVTGLMLPFCLLTPQNVNGNDSNAPEPETEKFLYDTSLTACIR